MMTKRAQRGRRFCSKRRIRFVIPQMKRDASRHERRVARQMLIAGEDPKGPVTEPVTAWDVY